MAEGEAAPVEAPRPTKKRSPNRLVVEEAMNDDNSVPLAKQWWHQVVLQELSICKIFRIHVNLSIWSFGLCFVCKEMFFVKGFRLCGLMLLVAVNVIL